MPTLAIDLDDAALAIAIAVAADADAASAAAPSIEASIVLASTAAGPGPGIGAAAGSLLRRRPSDVSTRHWSRLATREAPSAAAALARAELRARLAALSIGPGDAAREADVAVAAHFDAEALGWALGVLRGAGIEPRRLVDAAALRCAALGLQRDALVIDAGLHHLSVARVVAEQASNRRTALQWRAGSGTLALHDAWLALAAEAMVLRHRFDPLHDGATEQRLYDLLPAAAVQAAAEGRATLTLERAGAALDIELTRDQFATRAAPVYRELLALLHALRPAGAALAIVVDARVAAWPGLIEQLDELHGCVLHTVAAGTTTAALQSLFATATATATAAAAVRLQRQVARLAPPLPPAVATRALGSTGARAAAPTHLLHAGRAWPLRSAVLEIGRAPDARGLALPDGMAGVSRLHCTLRDEAGDIVLVDHSRHGSWINGERVAARARLRAGDVLRIGDPGIELALIAVAADGAAPG
jgi:hypothetical protein